jgi:phosphoribosylamine--glycine ligase
MRILTMGKEARLDCILEALDKSSHANELYTLSEVNNPGFLKKSEVRPCDTSNVEEVLKHAREIKPDFVVISPEEPLAKGVVDRLTQELGIPCVGPLKQLAQIEWSKSFARELLSEYGIPGNPEHKIFRSPDPEGIRAYMRELDQFVVKPDGLTGGKGVMVYGEHLHSLDEAMDYCTSLFSRSQGPVIIEERLDGEEFSLQSFCDGQHVVDTPAVQDHKRAYDGDEGPNTGGMGSYSCEDHSLPFLSKDYIQQASRINDAVAQALLAEFEQGFKGILYGGFMVTKKGLKLVEYNARFGDPEVMNVLPLLKTDFIDVCLAIINGTLDRLTISFEKKATVCKYIVPKGYPSNPEKGERIYVDNVPVSSDKLKVYYAAVDEKDGILRLTGSRALAFVGIGDNIPEAERIAEDAASKVEGPVRHREDIGRSALIQKRIDHVNRIMSEQKSERPAACMSSELLPAFKGASSRM